MRSTTQATTAEKEEEAAEEEEEVEKTTSPKNDEKVIETTTKSSTESTPTTTTEGKIDEKNPISETTVSIEASATEQSVLQTTIAVIQPITTTQSSNFVPTDFPVETVDSIATLLPAITVKTTEEYVTTSAAPLPAILPIASTDEPNLDEQHVTKGVISTVAQPRPFGFQRRTRPTTTTSTTLTPTQETTTTTTTTTTVSSDTGRVKVSTQTRNFAQSSNFYKGRTRVNLIRPIQAASDLYKEDASADKTGTIGSNGNEQRQGSDYSDISYTDTTSNTSDSKLSDHNQNTNKNEPNISRGFNRFTPPVFTPSNQENTRNTVPGEELSDNSSLSQENSDDSIEYLITEPEIVKTKIASTRRPVPESAITPVPRVGADGQKFRDSKIFRIFGKNTEASGRELSSTDKNISENNSTVQDIKITKIRILPNENRRPSFGRQRFTTSGTFETSSPVALVIDSNTTQTDILNSTTDSLLTSKVYTLNPTSKRPLDRNLYARRSTIQSAYSSTTELSVSTEKVEATSPIGTTTVNYTEPIPSIEKIESNDLEVVVDLPTTSLPVSADISTSSLPEMITTSMYNDTFEYEGYTAPITTDAKEFTTEFPMDLTTLLSHITQESTTSVSTTGSTIVTTNYVEQKSKAEEVRGSPRRSFRRKVLRGRRPSTSNEASAIESRYGAKSSSSSGSETQVPSERNFRRKKVIKRLRSRPGTETSRAQRPQFNNVKTQLAPRQNLTSLYPQRRSRTNSRIFTRPTRPTTASLEEQSLNKTENNLVTVPISNRTEMTTEMTTTSANISSKTNITESYITTTEMITEKMTDISQTDDANNAEVTTTEFSTTEPAIESNMTTLTTTEEVLGTDTLPTTYEYVQTTTYSNDIVTENGFTADTTLLSTITDEDMVKATTTSDEFITATEESYTTFQTMGEDSFPIETTTYSTADTFESTTELGKTETMFTASINTDETEDWSATTEIDATTATISAEITDPTASNEFDSESESTTEDEGYTTEAQIPEVIFTEKPLPKKNPFRRENATKSGGSTPGLLRRPTSASKEEVFSKGFDDSPSGNPTLERRKNLFSRRRLVSSTTTEAPVQESNEYEDEIPDEYTDTSLENSEAQVVLETTTLQSDTDFNTVIDVDKEFWKHYIPGSTPELTTFEVTTLEVTTPMTTLFTQSTPSTQSILTLPGRRPKFQVPTSLINQFSSKQHSEQNSEQSLSKNSNADSGIGGSRTKFYKRPKPTPAPEADSLSLSEKEQPITERIDLQSVDNKPESDEEFTPSPTQISKESADANTEVVITEDEEHDENWRFTSTTKRPKFNVPVPRTAPKRKQNRPTYQLPSVNKTRSYPKRVGSSTESTVPETLIPAKKFNYAADAEFRRRASTVKSIEPDGKPPTGIDFYSTTYKPTVTRIVTSIVESGTTERQRIKIKRKYSSRTATSKIIQQNAQKQPYGFSTTPYSNFNDPLQAKKRSRNLETSKFSKFSQNDIVEQSTLSIESEFANSARSARYQNLDNLGVTPGYSGESSTIQIESVFNNLIAKKRKSSF